MDTLLEIRPISWYCYIAWVIIGSLGVRLFVSIWKNFESREINIKKIFRIFIGIGYENDKSDLIVAADYWLGFFIGIIELLSYPILLLSGHSIYIGAWLAFKTVNRWKYAPEYERGHFNRYLLANAFIILISYVLAVNMFIV